MLSVTRLNIMKKQMRRQKEKQVVFGKGMCVSCGDTVDCWLREADKRQRGKCCRGSWHVGKRMKKWHVGKRMKEIK